MGWEMRSIIIGSIALLLTVSPTFAGDKMNLGNGDYYMNMGGD